MLPQRAYVVNITQVVVESYSDNELATPSYAKIIMRNSGVTMLSPKTVYNIIKDTTLRLDTMVKSSEISDDEENNIKIPKAMFLSNRASLKLERINATASYDSDSDRYEFLRVTY